MSCSPWLSSMMTRKKEKKKKKNVSFWLNFLLFLAPSPSPKLSPRGVHPLRDETEDGYGAHEEDCVVELYHCFFGGFLFNNTHVWMYVCVGVEKETGPKKKKEKRAGCVRAGARLTAFLETWRSSSSLRASMKRRRRLGKLAWDDG